MCLLSLMQIKWINFFFRFELLLIFNFYWTLIPSIQGVNIFKLLIYSYLICIRFFGSMRLQIVILAHHVCQQLVGNKGLRYWECFTKCFQFFRWMAFKLYQTPPHNLVIWDFKKIQLRFWMTKISVLVLIKMLNYSKN